MNTEEIIKFAFELGNAISQSEEMELMREIQNRLIADSDTYNLVLRYQDIKGQMEHKIEDGLLVTQAEENHLKIMEQQINSSQLVQELVAAQEKMDSLMQGVYLAMNQAISGESCSSGCEGCNGGCVM